MQDTNSTADRQCIQCHAVAVDIPTIFLFCRGLFLVSFFRDVHAPRGVLVTYTAPYRHSPHGGPVTYTAPYRHSPRGGPQRSCAAAQQLGAAAKLRSSAVYVKHPSHPLIRESQVTVGDTRYDK